MSNPVAQFTIQYLQYLDKSGSLQTTIPPHLDNPTLLLELYRSMVITRAFDQKAVAMQRTGKMGTFASSLGQEAISVGIGNSMLKEDVLCPYYRDQGIMFQRGIKFSDIFSYWGGDERGSWNDGVGEDLPIAIPVASQALHAVGVGYAMKLRNEKRAVVTTCGDGGTSKGDFYEALNAAGVWDLPVVFVVNNNQWAISVPLSQQTKTQTIAQKAIAGGFEGIQVDGNDVLAVQSCAQSALEKARSGGGPTLIEALSYRLCDHTTADDATRYVPQEDMDEAWKREPILRLQTYLINGGHLTESDIESIHEECKSIIEKASQDYLQREPQPATTMYDYLYSELPEAYLDERNQMEEK